MLSSILTDPFATNSPAVLQAATATLKTVLSNCWPRLTNTPWQEEVTKILVVCWLHIKEEDKNLPDVEKGLVRAAQMLIAIMEAGKVDLTGDTILNLNLQVGWSSPFRHP